MKILQLCPRPIFPPDDGGRISMYNVSKHLLHFGAELSILCFDPEAPALREQQIDDASVNIYSLNHQTKNSATRIFSSVFQSEALYLRKHFSAEILRQSLSIAESVQPDVIHVDHTAMAPLGFALRKHLGCLVGLRLHNVEWKIWKRYAEQLPAWHPKRWYVASQAAKLRRDEAQYIAMADVAFPISQVDLDAARDLAPKAHLVLAAAGVNSAEWKADAKQPREENTLVMASAWSWQHNVDGAHWFLREVLPLVQRSLPQTRVLVPGRHAAEHFARYKERGVECLGYVEKMQPTYHRGSVFVVPLFVGSGVRIKIMEAMAAGLVVVSTSIGAEGIAATQEHGLYTSDNAATQAQMIVRLLSDHSVREAASKKAAEYVATHHEWRDQIENIYRSYEALLKR